MKILTILQRYTLGLVILFALIFSSCQAGLIQTGNNGLQLNLQGFPKALLSSNFSSGSSANRGLLTNGGSIHITVSRADGSGTPFFDQTVVVSLINGQAVAQVSIGDIPINTSLRIGATVVDGNGAVMFSAVSQIVLNALARQQVSLSVIPNSTYTGIGTVSLSGMASISLVAGQSSILRLNPAANQVNLPFVLSWDTNASAPSISVTDANGKDIAFTAIENGQSGLRFVPSSTNLYYVVIGNGSQNNLNLTNPSGFSGEKLVYTAAGTNTVTIPSGLSSNISVTGFAWGAGGSGAKYYESQKWAYGLGGGGGYSTVIFSASPGNEVIAVVGEQGHYMSGPLLNQPAAGGASTSQGSGGGASLIIYNNKKSYVLNAVAGGGGGGAASSDRNGPLQWSGGAGGGASGDQDESQTAFGGSGGAGGSNLSSTGASMARSVTSNQALVTFGGAGGGSTTSGAGGGGFGGGSAGEGTNTFSYGGGAGGGGLSLSGPTQNGSGIYPASTKNANYGSGNAGLGGDGSAATLDGYPGRIVLYLYY